jgi:hypothetical protein
LPFGDSDVSVVFAGRLEHAKADGVKGDDEKRSNSVGNVLQFAHSLQATEKVGMLDDNAAS